MASPRHPPRGSDAWRPPSSETLPLPTPVRDRMLASFHAPDALRTSSSAVIRLAIAGCESV
eukprot:7188072-Pyramimonas_sp.AAC.1